MRLAMRSMSGVISSAPRSHLSGLSARAIGYAILGVLWMLPFWTHAGACPMGLHDWAYPCLDQQRNTYLPSLVAPWWDTDLGIAHALPQITLPWLFLGALVWISPALGLRLFILAAFTGAAIAADVASERLFGVSRGWARFIGGALYAGSPFLATKLASGQLGFIACASLVPAALVSLDTVARGGGIRPWAACAICAASAFAQVQVGVILLLLLPVVAWGRVRARVWLGVWAVAALTWLPAAYSTIVAYRSGVLAPEAQLAIWLAEKSVPWRHALDGTAYFANYFASTAPPLSIVSFTFISIIGFVGAVAIGGPARRLAVFAIVLGLVATGTTGPVGPLVAWLFEHATPVQVFREFYDLLFLAPLVVACAAAAGAAASEAALAQRSDLRILAIVVECGIACVLLYPTLTGAAASLVPFVSGLPQAPPIAGDDRILWLPATPPVGPPNSIGGADPYQLSLGPHPDASAFHPTGVLSYVDALADRARPVSKAMLERLDVADSIVRRGLVSQRIATSASVHEGAIASAIAPAAPPVASLVAIAAGEPVCEPDLRSALMRDLTAYARCDPRWSVVPREDTASSTDDPKTGWIGGERWALLDPHLAETRWPVLFTRSTSTYRWQQPADGITWVYAPGGAVLNGLPVVQSRAWRPLATKTGYNSLEGDGRGIVAVSASLPGPQLGRASLGIPQGIPHGIPSGKPQERPLQITSSDRLRGSFEAIVPAHERSFVVLRAGWSSDWHGTVDGRDLGPARIADGYATGWPLAPSTHASTLSIEFAPSPAYLAMLAASWIVLTLLAVLLVRGIAEGAVSGRPRPGSGPRGKVLDPPRR